MIFFARPAGFLPDREAGVPARLRSRGSCSIGVADRAGLLVGLLVGPVVSGITKGS